MEWKPIETAPKDGTVVLAFWDYPANEAHQKYGMAKWAEGCWMEPNQECEYATPTHWMPLPEPPKS